MKNNLFKGSNRIDGFAKINLQRRWLVIGAVTICGAVLIAASTAYTREVLREVKHYLPDTTTYNPHFSTTSPSGRLRNRLSLQPMADRFRRLLGKRFVERGKERCTQTGTLTVGSTQYQISIVRSQTADGEDVAIALNGGPFSLTWSTRDGAKSAESVATGAERELIERVALDSPDQFVLAQVRGASYYLIARNVRPSEAGDSEDYAGPVWDLVRIGEPNLTAQNNPQAVCRVYHINTVTGLIDRVFSREQGREILAEFSDWVKQGTELSPTHIAWSTNGQVVMKLFLNNITQSSIQ